MKIDSKGRILSFSEKHKGNDLKAMPQDGPDESPTSILQIMTSFLVDRGLLSPLLDDLICLTEKEKLWKKSKSELPHKGCQESLNTSDFARSDAKVVEDKKPKSFEKNAPSVGGVRNGHDKNF